jgi:hypothetical protein
MWAWSKEAKFAEIRTNAVLNSSSLIRVPSVYIDSTVMTELEFKTKQVLWFLQASLSNFLLKEKLSSKKYYGN